MTENKVEREQHNYQRADKFHGAAYTVGTHGIDPPADQKVKRASAIQPRQRKQIKTPLQKICSGKRIIPRRAREDNSRRNIHRWPGQCADQLFSIRQKTRIRPYFYAKCCKAYSLHIHSEQTNCEQVTQFMERCRQKHMRHDLACAAQQRTAEKKEESRRDRHLTQAQYSRSD